MTLKPLAVHAIAVLSPAIPDPTTITSNLGIGFNAMAAVELSSEEMKRAKVAVNRLTERYLLQFAVNILLRQARFGEQVMLEHS